MYIHLILRQPYKVGDVVKNTEAENFNSFAHEHIGKKGWEMGDFYSGLPGSKAQGLCTLMHNRLCNQTPNAKLADKS